jgi:hypothetical protein
MGHLHEGREFVKWARRASWTARASAPYALQPLVAALADYDSGAYDTKYRPEDVKLPPSARRLKVRSRLKMPERLRAQKKVVESHWSAGEVIPLAVHRRAVAETPFRNNPANAPGP